MRAVAFDIRGPMAHFRRPDTVVTHCSYPFITRTALGGLVCAILGRQELQGEHWFGLRIMKPVTTCFQKMSMLGKGWLGGGSTFSRPTAIELIVNPHYRVYYCGDDADELEARVRNQRSVYTTYLGSASCLTFPHLIGTEELRDMEASGIVTTYGVVPSFVVDELIIEPGVQYARCNGVRYRHVADRVFEGVIDFIYETSGRPIRFRPKSPLDENSGIPTKLVSGGSGPLCLW